MFYGQIGLVRFRSVYLFIVGNHFSICLQNPKWNPVSLNEANPKDVEAIFEPLGQGMEELKV